MSAPQPAERVPVTGSDAAPDGTAAERARLNAALDEAVASQLGFDPDAALTLATEVEHAAGRLGDDALRMRARMLRAYALEGYGDIGTAARLTLEVNRWAAEHDHRPLLSLSHRRLSTTYLTLGDAGACLDHAVRCVQTLDDTIKPYERANCLIVLGDALGLTGSMDEARRRYRAAEEILAGIGDVERQLVALNNLAEAEVDAGEGERAWAAAERMLTLAAAHHVPLDYPYLDTVARAQMSLGRPDDAARTLEGWLASRNVDELEADAPAEVLLTLAEVHRLQGDLRRAQVRLDRCLRLCEEVGRAGLRLRVLAEQAELYAAAGDFRRAFETHKSFHTAHEELRSREGEARARIRQAMFETEEARREAARFRDQARRDPLTGLRNRRFVDENLPALLVRARDGGAPLTVALVDLDHFKRINDTLSHDVGDQVLVTVAGLLASAVEGDPEPSANSYEGGAGGFAARLGGEEFILVLAGTGRDDAVRRIEDVRRTVRAYPWTPITGDLPVTVSIGAATAGPDSTQRSLLQQADRRLYAAKRGGRDRVVHDDADRDDADRDDADRDDADRDDADRDQARTGTRQAAKAR